MRGWGPLLRFLLFYVRALLQISALNAGIAWGKAIDFGSGTPLPAENRLLGSPMSILEKN